MKPYNQRIQGMLFALFVAAAIMPLSAGAGAQWVPVEGVSFNTNTSLAQNLTALKGKVVELSLSSGGSLAGTVESVGAAAVHLSQLRGKEAYDALIPLDKITAVQVRFRTLERK